MAYLQVTTRDYDGEVSIVRFPCPELTAANIVAVQAAGDTLIAALQNVTRCIVTKHSYVTGDEADSQLEQSVNADANREAAWLVRYADTTTFEKYTLQVPGPNSAHKDAANRAYADLTEVNIGAFVDAFEAFVEVEANTVAVNSLQWVGRNT